ncbi:MAG: hypothetical protein GX456_05910 [Verrucomicrobia bacterium]|nr:hypothetical protein [Verrucomicrobiota bacterium]
MAPFDFAADPNGISRGAAYAVGVGRREAFGVRQLAAALFLCINNVPVTLFPKPHSGEISGLESVAHRFLNRFCHATWSCSVPCYEHPERHRSFFVAILIVPRWLLLPR